MFTAVRLDPSGVVAEARIAPQASGGRLSRRRSARRQRADAPDVVAAAADAVSAAASPSTYAPRYLSQPPLAAVLTRRCLARRSEGSPPRMSTDVSMSVNGRTVTSRVEPRKTLSGLCAKDCALAGVHVGYPETQRLWRVHRRPRQPHRPLVRTLTLQADSGAGQTVEEWRGQRRLHPLGGVLAPSRPAVRVHRTPGILLTMRELLATNPRRRRTRSAVF
ncbi:hypothetical protein HBB16_12470 [Pseudonocardia sp. MCCB 268]|nr:hypothetical protein [Pseudonocardia cytotoxica]